MTSNNRINQQFELLQKQILFLVKEIKLLITDNGENYPIETELNQVIANVEKLALRIAIVAPMKAGKSTIINAIAGQPLLPSRNAGMTTLPTEIIFDHQIYQPKLIIPENMLLNFRQTLRKLTAKIKELNEEKSQGKIANYPHLHQLIDEIYHLDISQETSEYENINKTLANINDILRLCTLLIPEQDPLETLTEFPQISTPFWIDPQINPEQKIGNLILVDTPGPNEAGEHKLTNIVSKQLNQCSLVLMIFDFTQLKTTAAENIKKEVQKVIELRGKEHLYVLINKVDQRREGDMTTAELQQFVMAELGIEHSRENPRIFEISAIQAFTSAYFLQEIGENKEIAIADFKSASLLAKEVYNMDWEEELETTTVTKLTQKAEKLWQNSGFDHFIDTAINHLILQSAFYCLKSALNVSNSHLLNLAKDQNKSNDIGVIIDKLSKKVTDYHQDLSWLELWQKVDDKLPEIHQIINREIDQDINQIKTDLNMILEQNLIKIELAKFRYKFSEYLLLFLIKFNQVLGQKTIYNWLISKLTYQPELVLQFNQVETAKNVINLAVQLLEIKIRKILNLKQSIINQKLLENQQNMIDFLLNQTQEIDDNLSQWFKDNHAQLLPIAQIKSDEIEKIKLDQDLLIIPKKPEQMTITIWYFLGLFEIKQPTTIKYEVSAENFKKIINLIIDHSLENMKNETKNYLSNNLKKSIDNMFIKLIELGSL
jgi:Dynamin family